MRIKVLNKTLTSENMITINNRKSILDNMLDENIEIFYGCMGGSCGACKCEIISGEEFIDKEVIRPKVYGKVEKNEFLPCIAKLKTDAPENAEIIIKKIL